MYEGTLGGLLGEKKTFGRFKGEVNITGKVTMQIFRIGVETVPAVLQERCLIHRTGPTKKYKSWRATAASFTRFTWCISRIREWKVIISQECVYT